jgi:leucyl aminopeptidase (aminopeptidase T)
MAANGGELPALAEALVGRALKLRRGENLIIETWTHGLPYAVACAERARALGAHPMMLVEDEGAYWANVERFPGNGGWTRPGAHEWAALAKTDAYLFFPGPADRPRFRALPMKLRASLVGYNAEWYRRARVARLRGVRCLLGYASDAQAAQWGVDGPEWRRSLTRGIIEGRLPAIARSGRSVAAKLRKGRTVRITAPNGTDVTLRLRGIAPVLDDGEVSRDDLQHGQNMTVAPPGTVVVAVDERSAKGIAIANRPSFLASGRTEGGEWEISEGRLRQYRYTSGQEEFERAYRAAPKGKDVVSMLSIGLNPALGPGVPQAEDQEAGAVTLGLGGNEEYGGSNRCPFVSWIVLGEATVAVDGRAVCDRGQLF